jgi:hypothetical protein
MREQFPFAGGYGFCINRTDNALAAKMIGGLTHHIRICHSGGIKRHLVSTRQQKGTHIFNRAHATANRKGDKALFSCAAHHIKHGATVFMGGVDVQKTNLIRARGVISCGGLNRIARIAQADEIHALNHAAIGHVQAGN